MCCTAECLQSDVVRVFVGNLVPSITDVALLRLFSRFGSASDFERNTEQGFAHLCIKGANGSNDIERCISSLNRTTWCGTTLRVERAREHFLARLKREWTEEQNQVSSPTKDVDDASSGDHFANFRKGKHTTFSFPDLEPSSVNLESRNEDQREMVKSSKLQSSSAIQSALNVTLSRAEAPLNSRPSNSARLDSTLALFGLSSTSVEGKQQAFERESDKKRHQPPHEHSPAKRPRSSTRAEQNKEEVTENPSLFDIGSEKQTANMVLEKLFPESQTTSDSTSFRRLGLYRKLLQAPDESNHDEDEVPRELRACVKATEPSHLSESIDRGSPAVSFRRAGLYRMLETQAPS